MGGCFGRGEVPWLWAFETGLLGAAAATAAQRECLGNHLSASDLHLTFQIMSHETRRSKMLGPQMVQKHMGIGCAGQKERDNERETFAGIVEFGQVANHVSLKSLGCSVAIVGLGSLA